MSTFSTLFGGESGQKFMLFTTSGTFTPPKPDTKVHVICIGGGGGGGSGPFSETAIRPSAGGSSSFGSLVSASGGQPEYRYGVPHPGFFGFGSGGSGNIRDGRIEVCGESGSIAVFTGTISSPQTVIVGAGGGKRKESVIDRSHLDGRQGAVMVWYE